MNGRIISTMVIAAMVMALASGAQAATVFDNVGVGDNDFNNAGNWDNGLPTNANGPGTISADATMSANYLMSNNSNPSVTEISINNNATLNTGDHLFDRSITPADEDVGRNRAPTVRSGDVVAR